MYNLRAIATNILKEYFANKNIDISLKNNSIEINNEKDRKLLHTLCFGVIRYFFELNFIVDFLVRKELDKKDLDIKYLIMIGIYQIKYTKIPDYAAINETVNASVNLKKEWTKGLINATLRSFIKKQELIETKIKEDEVAQYSHPKWFIKKVKSIYPDKYKDILNSNNEMAPLSLRVNNQKISTDDYIKILKEEEIEFTKIPGTSSGLMLNKAVNISEIPKFNDGFCSIQDGASQLTTKYLEPQVNEKILDACAAPGGKSCHLLEVEPKINLSCLEINPTRIEKITSNFKRLDLKAKILEGDAKEASSLFDKESFDKILLDAPCTATGIIRRQPDIKLNRSKKDISLCQSTQSEILDSLWKVLKVGGILLYSTCSIFPEENMLNIENFLSKNNGKLIPLDGKDHIQILPGENNMDGFFYAKIMKLG